MVSSFLKNVSLVIVTTSLANAQPVEPPPDAAPRTTPPLDRATFVRAVLARNPSIEGARQAVRGASARVRQASAPDDPMVDVGIAPLSIGSSAHLGYEAKVSQRIPWFGKRSLDSAIAQAEADASKNDLEATRRDLALAAVTLYGQYFVAARSLEINTDHVALLRSLRDGATAGFESGRGTAQDPLAAELELTHREHDSIVLRANRDIVVAQMNELLHEPPDAPLGPPPAVLPLPPPPDDTRATSVAADGSSRPEIAATKQRASAERTRAERAEKDALPDFNVSASYNSMWEMPEHRFMVGLGFNVPIFTGRRGGMAEEARAASARFDSEATRLAAAARTEVFVASTRLRESLHVAHLFDERLLSIARAEVDAARAAFVSSRSPFSAVLEAERNLRSVELDHQMTLAECDRRHAELQRARGLIPGLESRESRR